MELTARPDMEKVKSLLRSRVADSSGLDEVREDFRSSARFETFFLRQDLVALETILAEPQAAGTLLELVEDDANWVIDEDQTDRGAAAFLRGIADMLRAAIEEAESAR
ncbi:hypothetical protein [Actinoplanes couchii]|nr:hypothetical protein [Actinoplanes couchii]MDR6320834.1 hypothetical protein [Actinoplanes couchii]